MCDTRNLCVISHIVELIRHLSSGKFVKNQVARLIWPSLHCIKNHMDIYNQASNNGIKWYNGIT